MKQETDDLNNLRHSCAHLLAAAVMQLYPKAKRTIGPATEHGFYFDFDFGENKLSEEDLPIIEATMRKILPSWKGFERHELTADEAKQEYLNNDYKHELIEEFSEGGKIKVSFYKSGNYWDLCRGGHCEHPDKELNHFKLLTIAGAYWRGDEKNKMLTRIYGTCFPTKVELEAYLRQIHEAKKRDHRQIGKDMELFTISDEVGQGLILWLPKGYVIRDTLEQWAKETETTWGYVRVATPSITKAGLYYTSGHLPYYKNDMYPPMKLESGEEYYLKPMNCPHHHMIYKFKSRSYRELPLRLAEYGDCYRYEASGELFGLMRVRGFTQNDAHIYCTLEQTVDEFVKVIQLHEYYYKSLGIMKYHLELSLRDPKNREKYHGDEKMWKLSEKLMREAVAKIKIPMVEQVGNAAFYGPKIDFIIHSSIGREFAISTNQIDLFMGKRFGLIYVDQNGTEQMPVIIHRAPLGSHERFIGFLIEHYAGKFPLWLSPVQVAIVPIAERHNLSARHVQEVLLKSSIRTILNDHNKTLPAKIRDSSLQKVPFMAIIGDQEVAKSPISLSIRSREGENLGSLTVAQFLDKLKKDIETKR